MDFRIYKCDIIRLYPNNKIQSYLVFSLCSVFHVIIELFGDECLIILIIAVIIQIEVISLQKSKDSDYDTIACLMKMNILKT